MVPCSPIVASFDSFTSTTVETTTFQHRMSDAMNTPVAARVVLIASEPHGEVLGAPFGLVPP